MSLQCSNYNVIIFNYNVSEPYSQSGGTHLRLYEPSASNQLKLQDHGHGANVSHGVPVYLPFCACPNMLLGNRGACVLTTCPGVHPNAEQLRIEPVTSQSQVQHPNQTATQPSCTCICVYVYGWRHGSVIRTG